MRYSTQIKPISYVKAHAAELLDRVNEEREPIIITQNGEARAVLMDIHSFEEAQETNALRKILAIGEKEIAEGKIYPLKDAINEIRKRRYVQSETPRRGRAVKENSESLVGAK
jgi:prevent-host-death family protein